MSKLTIYKASAGSGKTFTLTLEFFKIIFDNLNSYKTILAVTFTNKATGEMKSRIIRELHKLSIGEGSEYEPLLATTLNLSTEQVRERAKRLLTYILHDYGHLSVTTIDRFFQRILKAFTRELGIYPGYNVELDSDYILQSAVDQVMQRMNEDKSLNRWITQLMESSVEDAKAWSVKNGISDLGKELFNEHYMLLDEKLLDKFKDREFLTNYRQQLFKIIASYEKQLLEFGERGCRIIESAGLDFSDFKGGSKSFILHFKKMREGKLDSITATTYKVIDDPEGWVTKTQNPAIKATVESIYPELNQLLKDSVNFFETEGVIYNTAKQISNNLYQLGILNDLYKEVRLICEERGVMLLSDTTKVLNALIDGNHTSFLFEKTGTYYKHLMIDEFQDTSLMQWSNFRPLLINTLSEGGIGLLVGDVKQSIYRWRNGDWSLLAEGVERELSQFGVDNRLLDKNWRSREEIVNFNNRFFTKAFNDLKFLYENETGGESHYSKLIAEAYDGVEQRASKRGGGYVEVLFATENDREPAEMEIMESIVAAVTDYRRRGGALRDCVILVRNSREGIFVANYLMEYNDMNEVGDKIPFISNDSLYVEASPYVGLIVNILNYIADPTDEINIGELLYNYFTLKGGKESELLDNLFRITSNKDHFENSFPGSALQTMDLPGTLFELVETIITTFELNDNSDELPYIIAFQDLLFEFEASVRGGIALFPEWWEKEKSKRVISASEESDAIRILTIHKSKGLEFRCVLLPFCSWELDDVRHGRRIWGKNRDNRFNSLEYVPINYSSRLKETLFSEDYLSEHLKAYVDNLNLLYVALTRAEEELYIYPHSPKYTKDGTPVNIGGLSHQVLSALYPEIVEDDEKCAKLSVGEKSSISKGISKSEHEVISIRKYPVHAPGERLAIRFLYGEYTDLQMLHLSPLEEGRIFHEIFREINRKEDAESVIDKFYYRGLIEREEREYYMKKITEYLQQPEVVQWFDGSWDILSEHSILLPSSNQVRPDRVMFKNRESVVLDYKFGKQEKESYNRQVAFYCSTLRKMGYSNCKGYIWYAHLKKVVRVL